MKDVKMVEITFAIPEDTFDNVMKFRGYMLKKNDPDKFRFFNYCVTYLIEKGLLTFSEVKNKPPSKTSDSQSDEDKPRTKTPIVEDPSSISGDSGL